MSKTVGSNASSPANWPKRQVVVEIALVFAVFFLQGAWPVPDVNEPYYLSKAIHFWNRDWAPGDFFLNSADAHQVFCFTFGWLSLLLPLPAVAWFGRLVTWGLMAWAWWRLSFALVPRRWFSVLTAALFVCLMERFHMAGEWVIGGVEAKGFAYVLVFLALEALVRNRWNRVWLLLGAASAFHVLVGGWSAVAASVAWLALGNQRPPLKSMWLALLGGFLLSLPGLIPSLALNWGVDPQIVSEANQIYVFQRLAHHLAPSEFPPVYLCRFMLLLLALLALDRSTPMDSPCHRLRMFVVGAIAIMAAGMLINVLVPFDKALAAGLLRFYWFRLSDVAVPLAIAMFGARYVMGALRTQPRWGKCALGVGIMIAGVHVGWYAIMRPFPRLPRADQGRVYDYSAWRRACAWVVKEGNVPPDASFITPIMSQTFKWYTGRSEVVTWKEVPQDARSIVQWSQRMHEIYYTGTDEPGKRWYGSLGWLGAERLRRLAAEYQAEYVLTAKYDTHLASTLRPAPKVDLPVAYENQWYIIYRLDHR